MFVFVPVWGGEHISWFLSYCLKSLIQENNLPLVKKEKEVIFFFYTRNESFNHLSNSIKGKLNGFKYKIFTEENFNDCARDMMSNYFLHALGECVKNKALLLIAPPDSFFSNGAIGNMVAISNGKGVSVAVPHARVSAECIERNDLEMTFSASEMDDIIQKCPHRTLLLADDSLDSNSTSDGLSIRKIKKGMLVTHNLPSIYLCDPINSDVTFFKRRPLFNIVDKVWPHMLFRHSRLKIVASSDVASIVEMTHDQDKFPEVLHNMKNNDLYKGFPPFMNYSNIVVGLWRGK